MNVLKYKGYEGTAEIDMERQVCRGKVLFVKDLVTYEAKSPSRLQEEFEKAVDDYLETCANLGRKPERQFRGQFNVRVSPEVHRAAALRAVTDRVSLNEIVARSLDLLLNSTAEVNHHLHLTIEDDGPQFKSLTSSSSEIPKWETATNGHSH